MRTGFLVMKTGFSLWELNYREFLLSLWVFCSKYYPVSCSLFAVKIVTCQLFVVKIVPCQLFAVLCLLFSVPCFLFTVPCSLFHVCYFLFPVYCSLLTVPHLLFHVYYSLFPVPHFSFFQLYFWNCFQVLEQSACRFFFWFSDFWNSVHGPATARRHIGKYRCWLQRVKGSISYSFLV